MRIALAIYDKRISSVLDTAQTFLLVQVQQACEQYRQTVHIEEQDVLPRAQKILDMGAHVLVCGAVSRYLEELLVQGGMKLIPNTCGEVQQVLEHIMTNKFTNTAFLMPGCRGQRRCQRRRRRRKQT